MLFTVLLDRIVEECVCGINHKTMFIIKYFRYV